MATTEVREVVVQPLAVASTQYVVVLLMLGVVNEVPVPSDEPPVEAEYQLMVPAEAVAPSTTVPVPQREPGVVPVMVGMALTVATTALRLELTQPVLVLRVSA